MENDHVDASVEERRAYYSPGGAGWAERRDEALRVLEGGGSLAEAADAVLMSEHELREALGVEGSQTKNTKWAKAA